MEGWTLAGRKTRRTKADQLADQLIRHQVSVLRVSAGLEASAAERVGRVRDVLIGRLNVVDPTLPSRIADKRKRAEELAAEARKIVEREFRDIEREAKDGTREIAAKDVKVTARDAERMSGLTVDVLPMAQIRAVVDRALIEGSPLSEWWGAQSDKVARDFAARVRGGIENGDSIQKITANLRGTKEHGFKDGDYATWKRNATTLVQTSVMSVVNSVRFEQMAQNPEVYRAYTWSAIFDPKTCTVCQALAGGIFDTDTGAPTPDSPVQVTPDVPHPPQHPNCRCIMLPVVVGHEPPKDVSYEQWLEQQPESVQVEALGVKRWELWSDGQLSGLSDLLRQDGRVIPVKDL